MQVQELTPNTRTKETKHTYEIQQLELELELATGKVERFKNDREEARKELRNVEKEKEKLAKLAKKKAARVAKTAQNAKTAKIDDDDGDIIINDKRFDIR